MKKVIYIADSYSLNTGDIGILIATVEQLKQTDPTVTIHIESSHPSVVEEYDLNCEVFPRIFNIEKIIGEPLGKVGLLKEMLTGFYDSFTFWLFAVFTRLHLPGIWIVRPSRRRQADAIRETDLWLSSGGGFLSSFYRPLFRFYGYELARIMRKPYFIFAQSVGPFHGWLHTTLATFYLNRAAGIFIREDDSYEYVKHMKLTKQPMLTADIAFLLSAQTSQGHDVPAIKSAAICVKQSDKNYESSMLSAAQHLIKSGYFVYLVSQTPNDDKLAINLQQRVAASSEAVPFGTDPRILKGLYGRGDIIVATRMHALIFAVEQGVPWVGIGYEPKFRGLSKQLGETGILIEESALNTTVIIAAINQALALQEPTVHPAHMLSEKAKQNTAAVLDLLGQEA